MLEKNARYLRLRYLCMHLLAASVLRMIFNVFDERVHIEALRDYLKRYRGGTANPTDLWKSFDPYVSISPDGRQVSLEEVMNTWTNQPGYPVVHARLNDSKLTLTQVSSC